MIYKSLSSTVGLDYIEAVLKVELSELAYSLYCSFRPSVNAQRTPSILRKVQRHHQIAFLHPEKGNDVDIQARTNILVAFDL